MPGLLGVAVAKVGEAEVMAAIDNLDILVAYPAVGAARRRNHRPPGREKITISAWPSIPST